MAAMRPGTSLAIYVARVSGNAKGTRLLRQFLQETFIQTGARAASTVANQYITDAVEQAGQALGFLQRIQTRNVQFSGAFWSIALLVGAGVAWRVLGAFGCFRMQYCRILTDFTKQVVRTSFLSLS